MDRAVVLALGLLIAFAPAAHAQRAQGFDKRVREFVVHDAARIRIDDVRIVDGTGSPVVAGQSVLVVDGKIARLGPAADLKASAPTS